MSKIWTKRAGWLTIFWVAFWVFTICLEWQNFKTLSFNEVGDFMAGAFGPVAFLWLVLGFFQQGEELRASSHALTEQQKELRASAMAQSELVATNQKMVAYQQQAQNQSIWLDTCRTELKLRDNHDRLKELLDEARSARRYTHAAKGQTDSSTAEAFALEIRKIEEGISNQRLALRQISVLKAESSAPVETSTIHTLINLHLVSNRYIEYLEAEIQKDLNYSNQRSIVHYQ
ncbi:MAG: hypothetical protein EP336_05075 [Rhodobacteraceae bacterium]|nr:MAG: hypothetical protein EP336_05075 [Paracoccaceae bacterium]